MKKLYFIIGLAIATLTMNAQCVPSYIPSDGLVAYYPFNGNANDESGTGNNGSVIGAILTADRFGVTNKAYSFDGVSSRIDVSDSNSQLIYGAQKGVTISMWINRNDNLVGDLISKGFHSDNIPSLGNKYVAYGFSPTEDNKSHIQFSLYDFQTLNTVSTDAEFATSTWFHLVIVRNESVKIYVNGVDVTTDANNAGWNTDYNSVLSGTPFTIGARNNKNDSGNQYYNSFFNGKIDDIGIWNRALTEEEITNLFNANICYQNITVTDTLIINTGILSYNPVTYNSTVTIYPNPANDHITIDCGTLANVTGYSIKISNSLGQVVFNQPMNTQQYVVPLNGWTGQGIYFVNIIDNHGTTIDTRKIILQ